MVSIRPARDGDQAALGDIHRAAFGQPLEAQLVEELASGGYDRITLVAEVEGQIVGHVLLTDLRLDLPPLPPNSPAVRALALAPLAVAPSYQRQGVGSALVRAALDEAREQGWRLVFVLGDPEYYGRFGFTAERAAPFQCVYACAAFMAIALHADAAPNGTLEYAPPFAEL
ncbi:MAG: N-acetyltransferase [Pirellulales bacterium]